MTLQDLDDIGLKLFARTTASLSIALAGAGTGVIVCWATGSFPTWTETEDVARLSYSILAAGLALLLGATLLTLPTYLVRRRDANLGFGIEGLRWIVWISSIWIGGWLVVRMGTGERVPQTLMMCAPFSALPLIQRMMWR